ncbi:MAG: porin [Pirellulales bacterium]|nr:porin [Pirellulales bacterium]
MCIFATAIAAPVGEGARASTSEPEPTAGTEAVAPLPSNADIVSAAEGDNDAGEEEPEEDAPCRTLNRWLLGDCWSARTGVSVQGWLAQGFTFNPDCPPDRFNGPVGFNDRANEYQLNQLYATIERAAPSDAGRFSLGFRGDVIYGTDAFQFQALGLDDRIVSDAGSRFYKVAFPQLYVEAFLPVGRGLTAQIGKWYALVGYEWGLATEDFFYSHTIGFNPSAYTHTGVLLSYDLADQLSASYGIHRGNDVWEDNNTSWSHTANATWTSRDERTSVYVAVALGPEQDSRADWQDLDGLPGADAPGENLERVVYSVTLEQQLSEKLHYVLNHDGFYQEGSARYEIDRGEAYGFTQYLFYEVSEKLALGLRYEILRDDDGYVAYGYRSLNTAAPGLYTNLTLGANYRWGTCVTIRPEVRWDWQDRDDPADPAAFDGGSSVSQFLLATDIVMRF